jgi:hypothetical protein
MSLSIANDAVPRFLFVRRETNKTVGPQFEELGVAYEGRSAGMGGSRRAWGRREKTRTATAFWTCS